MHPIESIRAELAELTNRGLLRRMRPVDGANQAELTVDGRAVLNFSSNNYLGLANDASLVSALCASAASGGFGAAGSRLVSGSVAPHRELEQKLASWLGVERALLFNSGYQANVGVLSALLRPGDAVFSDALNHASLIDGCRLSRADIHVYPHSDVAALRVLLARSHASRKVVLTESVFSMDGDAAPLADLGAVCRSAGALLLVDEAHAVGVLGPRGVGLSGGVADLVVGTFGKAFGGCGAYVAGPEPVIELIAQRARSFLFSTALPGLISSGNAAALTFIASDAGDARRSAVAARCSQLAAGLRELGLSTVSRSHIQPLLMLDPDPHAVMQLSETLLRRGLFVQGIRPPTVPRGTSRLRITLMATHTEGHVAELLGALSQVRNELSGAT